MSGGVDSTAAALLLKRQGYDVVGATLELLPENMNADDIGDAREAAALIGIPHYVFDMKDRFSADVIDYFCCEYLRGATPNPCVRCNKCIKFGALAQKAAELGCNLLATGHYARIGSDGGRYFVRKAAQAAKDQSYMLWQLSQDVLSHVIFPLGDMSKTEIRAVAAEAGLNTASKRDSQDICFIPDGDYAAFLTKRTGAEPIPGDFIDREGNVLGRHGGMIHYTPGQRKGLGVTFGEPRYVISKNAENNTVTLGKSEELFVSRVNLEEVNIQLFDKLDSPITVTAKTRYSQHEAPAALIPTQDGAVLEFAEPVRAPAVGQSAVFYIGDAVVGGGVIR